MGSRRKKKQELPVAPVIAVCVALIAVLVLGIALCCRVIWDGNPNKPATNTDIPKEPGNSGEKQTGNTASTTTPSSGENGNTGERETPPQNETYSPFASDGVTPMFVPDSVEKIDEALNSDFLRLVNKSKPIGEDYVPGELADIDGGREEVDSRIADSCNKFIEDIRAAGYTDLYPCSGYRTYEWQYEHYMTAKNNYIYEGYSEEEAETLTGRDYQYPGCSEHQYGMCMDIVTYSYVEESGLTDGFDKTDCWKWIDENDYKYGFILRYGKDKEDVTGIMYEPWHYRYVGVEHAAFMKEHDMCLEEYIQFLQEKRAELAGE